MKNSILLAIAAISLTANAQTYTTVHFNDGTAASHAIDQIERIEFTDADLTTGAVAGSRYTITFEPGSGLVADAEGNNVGWLDLVDSAEYYGPLLYGAGYGWRDMETSLSCSFTGAFWNGGTALSNYTMTNYSGATYTNQLSAWQPVAGLGGGADRSQCFLVANGSWYEGSWSDSRPILTFADGTARVVESMMVNLGCYGIDSLMGGNAYADPATDATHVIILCEGLDADGNVIAESQTDAALGTDILTEWTRWNLSGLGAVNSLRFNVVDLAGDQTGDYGLNFPAYFLIDNVTVVVD